MKNHRTYVIVLGVVVLFGMACSRPATEAEPPGEDGDGTGEPAPGAPVASRDAGSRRTDGAALPASSSPGDRPGGPGASRPDASATDLVDGGLPSDGGWSGGSEQPDAAQSTWDAEAPGESDAGAVAGETCALPTTFKWTGGGPLAQPKNGAVAMKDFTHVVRDGEHILYFTTYQSSWGSAMMVFKDWPDAAAAPQVKLGFGVAPTLFYFTPKKIWVLSYQWGPHKFSYRTSADPTDASSWSGEKSLYNTALPPGGTGPIDQTVICNGEKCYLFYAGDNGHVYKSSMPIASFPGEFPAAQDSGIVGTAQNLFEAVQVYRVKGSDEYLMIVEAQGPARYFRAWTATSLDGPWTLLTNDFAVKKNVTLSTNWTNDISHGDIVRSNPDETFMIDPCNLQLVFQGRDPNVNTEYGRLPYRLGLLTLLR
jgi:Glycosyl hydrolase family 62